MLFLPLADSLEQLKTVQRDRRPWRPPPHGDLPTPKQARHVPPRQRVSQHSPGRDPVADLHPRLDGVERHGDGPEADAGAGAGEDGAGVAAEDGLEAAAAEVEGEEVRAAPQRAVTAIPRYSRRSAPAAPPRPPSPLPSQTRRSTSRGVARRPPAALPLRAITRFRTSSTGVTKSAAL